MNMFLHELRACRKSMIVWTITLIAIGAFYLSLFPAIYSHKDEFIAAVKGYGVYGKMIGFQIDYVTSFLGFYSFTFVYVLLCGAIQAMNLGTAIVSKEIREKTADFLLTKPVTRFNIITAKILAVLTSLIITNVIYLVAMSFVAPIVSKNSEAYSYKAFFLISFTLFFVQLMFMAIGIFISVIAKKIKSVLTVSLSVVFGFFIISMFGSVIGDNAVRYITPFKYFDSIYIINHKAYESSYVITGIVVMIIAIVASYYIYIKKDIHAV
jgi:ABC-2 type transport system permease protein